jgi:hypothetical protein
MGKAIVPRKTRIPKDTGGPVAKPPTGLTLAKVTAVTRHVLKDELTRISGPEIAQLIAANKPQGYRPPFVSAGRDLGGARLSRGGRGRDERGRLCGLGRPAVEVAVLDGECLRGLGRRVAALDPSGNSGPNWYAVEVTK